MLLRNKRIFIIEDNLANRAIMQMALEFEGARTEVERWGTDAVRRLRNFLPVDVILLDLMFPHNVTGYQVFDCIRAESDLAHIPIVAVSATDPAAALPITQARGFAGFLRKPIDQDTFASQIVTILQGDPVWERL